MLDLLNKQDVYLTCYCLDILSKYLYMFLINYLDTGTPVLRRVNVAFGIPLRIYDPVTRVGGNRVLGQTREFIDWWQSPQSSLLLLLVLYAHHCYWCYTHITVIGPLSPILRFCYRSYFNRFQNGFRSLLSI